MSQLELRQLGSCNMLETIARALNVIVDSGVNFFNAVALRLPLTAGVAGAGGVSPGPAQYASERIRARCLTVSSGFNLINTSASTGLYNMRQQTVRALNYGDASGVRPRCYTLAFRLPLVGLAGAGAAPPGFNRRGAVDFFKLPLYDGGSC